MTCSGRIGPAAVPPGGGEPVEALDFVGADGAHRRWRSAAGGCSAGAGRIRPSCSATCSSAASKRSRDVACHLLQVGMQLGVGRIAVPAFGAVGLEVRQLHQQLGDMPRALAGDRRGQAGEVGQRGVVPAARRQRWAGLRRIARRQRGRARSRLQHALQPLAEHGVVLRLAQQGRAGGGQRGAGRLGGKAVQHRLRQRGQRRRRSLQRGQPAFVQARFVHHQRVDRRCPARPQRPAAASANGPSSCSGGSAVAAARVAAAARPAPCR